MLNVHLNGTYRVTRAVFADMTQAGFGRIVNIASAAALNGGGPGLAHYAAAKAGIIGFTKALAHELGPSGVTVNAIAPGLIDTPLIHGAGAPAGPAMPGWTGLNTYWIFVSSPAPSST